MYYRIKKRLFSSNIVERGILKDDTIVWTPFIAPLVHKREGDVICDKLLKNLLNEARESIQSL